MKQKIKTKFRANEQTDKIFVCEVNCVCFLFLLLYRILYLYNFVFNLFVTRYRNTFEQSLESIRNISFATCLRMIKNVMFQFSLFIFSNFTLSFYHLNYDNRSYRLQIEQIYCVFKLQVLNRLYCTLCVPVRANEINIE